MSRYNSGIYKITSPTNRIYIGQSWYLNSRLSHYKKLKCKDQPHLFNSLSKYGYENHKVEIVINIPFDSSQDVMNEYELFAWNQYKEANFKMLNVKLPGSNGKHSEQTKLKISASNKGKPGNNKGKKLGPLSKETKLKISNSKKGNTFFSEETRKKISEGNKGKLFSLETRQKISKANKGHTRSKGKKLPERTERHRQNLSNSCKGRIISPEQKLKMSEARKKYWSNKKQTNHESIPNHV